MAGVYPEDWEGNSRASVAASVGGTVLRLPQLSVRPGLGALVACRSFARCSTALLAARTLRRGWGLQVWREHFALPADLPGCSLCTRCGRLSRRARSFERRPWVSGVDLGARGGLVAVQRHGRHSAGTAQSDRTCLSRSARAAQHTPGGGGCCGSLRGLLARWWRRLRCSSGARRPPRLPAGDAGACALGARRSPSRARGPSGRWWGRGRVRRLAVLPALSRFGAPLLLSCGACGAKEEARSQESQGIVIGGVVNATLASPRLQILLTTSPASKHPADGRGDAQTYAERPTLRPNRSQERFWRGVVHSAQTGLENPDFVCCARADWSLGGIRSRAGCLFDDGRAVKTLIKRGSVVMEPQFDHRLGPTHRLCLRWFGPSFASLRSGSWRSAVGRSGWRPTAHWRVALPFDDHGCASPCQPCDRFAPPQLLSVQ